MQPIILIPKLWHLPYLVSKVSSALFNIWIVTHINLSFILLNILLDQISSVLHGVGIKFKTTLPRIFLEFHQDADCARIVNRRRSFWCITHTLLGVAVCWKVHIQPAIASDSNDGEIRCMYKSVKKTKVIRRYMEALSLHTSAPTSHWEDNKVCISVVEAKIFTPRV